MPRSHPMKDSGIMTCVPPVSRVIYRDSWNYWSSFQSRAETTGWEVDDERARIV